MSQYSASGGMGIGMGGYPTNMQSSYYGQGNSGHNNSFSKGPVKKKTNAKNGMLAALHPSGTIHVGGSNAGMLSTDFKMTMKHNSSNHSIQSNKKMVGTIRKPTDLLGGNQLVLSGKKNAAGSNNSNYMSPYS